MSIDKNDPRLKPMGGLMLPPPQMDIARQDGTAVAPKENPKMRQVPIKIQPPPTPELKSAKSGGEGLRTGVVAQSSSEKVGEMGEIVRGMENNAQYIEQNTSGNVQKIGTFDTYEEKAKNDPAYVIQASTLNIVANYAGNVLSNKKGWSVLLKEKLENKVEKFEIKKPVEAEKKAEKNQDLALDLRKIKEERESGKIAPIKIEKKERRAEEEEEGQKTREAEAKQNERGVPEKIENAQKVSEEENQKSEKEEERGIEEKKAEPEEIQKQKIVPVQEEAENLQEENIEAPEEGKRGKIEAKEKIGEKESEEIDKEAQKNQNIQNNEIKQAAGEPTEKVVKEMQIPKNTRLANALDVNSIKQAQKNEGQRNEGIRKQVAQIPRKPPGTQEIQKQPERQQAQGIEKAQEQPRIKNSLAQALKKAPWLSKKPLEQKQVQNKQPEKEISPQEMYNKQRLVERKHEGILIAAENAQEAKIGENLKEQITDLAIKADDIFEAAVEKLKSMQTNAQKYSVLREIEQGLQKVENQIRAKWPEVKFA